MLLTTQKNDLFVAIQEFEFDVADFELQVSPTAKVKHKPSDFFFEFALNVNREYNVRHFPGKETAENWWNQYSWKEVLAIFNAWLSYLKRELSAPDLWAALNATQQLSDTGTELETSENTSFTTQEMAAIHAQLNEIRDYLFETQQISQSNQNRVTHQLDYLQGATERLGRIDWRGLFVDTVMSWVLSGIVPLILLKTSWDLHSERFSRC